MSYKKLEDEDHSIDLFQLENLINNNISFFFFNLSPAFAVDELEASLSALLKSSQAVTAEDVRVRLKKTDKSKPVVLICEKGDQSRDLVRDLQKKGFINVFFVTGGILSLLKDSR